MREPSAPAPWTSASRQTALPVLAEELFAGLYAGAPSAFWLDSARAAYGTGRYSIMGALECDEDLHVTWSARTRRLCTTGPGGPVSVVDDADVWRWIGDHLGRHPVPPVEGLPFAGGLVGYLGYAVPGPGCAPRPDERDRDAELLHVTRFLVLDHRDGVVHAVATGPVDAERERTAWLEAMEERVRDLQPPSPPPPASSEGGAARASVDRREYLDHVGQVQRWLLDGESYEACYTYRLEHRDAGDPFDTYRRLRAGNPAPYAAFLRLGDRAVLSCSPERFLQVTPDGWAETKPIKGTARRAADPGADAEVAQHLARDPKVRSENLMIVDLLRSDLGTVCLPGTVTVPDLMAVETYATVHQLVTTVRGRLEPRRGAAVAAARALFPPGSMTGAPKVRTVRLLDALERRSRGVYSGVLGYFSLCGRADLSVVIRTAVHDGDAVSIGTGGAITWQSDPEAEHDETVVKSTAVLAAYGLDHPDADHRSASAEDPRESGAGRCPSPTGRS